MGRQYIDGKTVILFIKRGAHGGNPADVEFRAVACLDSNSFSHDRELKEYTNKCVGNYRDGKAGKGTFGFDAAGKAISDVTEAEANYQELLEISVSGEEVQAKMANADGSVYRAGTTIITSYKEDSAAEEDLSFTATFAGLGVPVVKKPA
ncbi:Phage major tail protein 2 [compost metagenome]